MHKPYTLIDLERDIDYLNSELSDLRARKGHDYSGSIDTLDNLREFGWKGVIVRIGDKFKRLKHFITSNNGELQCLDAQIEDTLQDLINYSNYALIMYRQEREESSLVNNKEGFVLRQARRPEELPFMKDYQEQKSKGNIVDWENDIPKGEV